MATGILTANALDPNHLVSLCSLTLQPWVSPATLCLSRLAHPHHRLTAACPRRTSRRSPRRAPTCSLPAPPSSTVRPARRAPRPAPGRPPTPARAQHQPPPPRARARDCRLRVVAGLASPWLTVVPLPVRSRGLQGHHRRHARGARQGPLPGQGQGRRLDRRLGRRLSVGRRLRG